MLRDAIRTFKGLSPKTRMGIGAGVIAWGLLGPYVTDWTADNLSWTPPDKEKEELNKLMPKITVVDRNSDGGR